MKVSVITFSLLVFACNLYGSQTPLVIMISIDGLHPRFIFNKTNSRLHIPSIKSFLKKGVSATGVKGVIPTLTSPCHATILTGASPSKHGITGNTFFTNFPPTLDSIYYMYSHEIKLPTLWKHAQENGKIVANIGWPMSAGEKISYNVPEILNGKRDDPQTLAAILKDGLPGNILTKVEQETGPYKAMDQIKDDQQRTKIAELLLQRNKKINFLTLYLSSFDTASHYHGPDSKESILTLNEIDLLIGNIITTANKERGNDVIICIISDHGFLPIHTEININAILKKTGFITCNEKGEITSWKALAIQSNGTTGIVLNDENDSETYHKVYAILKKIDITYPCIQRILLKKDFSHEGFNNASFVIDARTGFSFNHFKLNNPIFNKSVFAGTHGFMPDRKEMKASFLIKGKGIPRGYNFKEINLIDIAPTIAALLKIPPLKHAEGKNLFHRN